MAQQKAPFIKVPTDKTGGYQTMPVEPEKRLPDSAVRIEPCTEKDAETIAEGLLLCFPEAWWASKEPPSLRPDHATRVQRLGKRLLPAFHIPTTTFIKAVLVATGQTIGIAGWTYPENKSTHNVFRRSAVEHYGLRDTLGWTDDEIQEMWSHTDDANWNGQFAREDEIRGEVMGGEPHWYLAPLITWPEFQGRGIGRRLLDWAIEKADAEVPSTPIYLEAAPSARAVYLHVGFLPVRDHHMLRRGPVTLAVGDVEEQHEDGRPEKKRES